MPSHGSTTKSFDLVPFPAVSEEFGKLASAVVGAFKGTPEALLNEDDEGASSL